MNAWWWILLALLIVGGCAGADGTSAAEARADSKSSASEASAESSPGDIEQKTAERGAAEHNAAEKPAAPRKLDLGTLAHDDYPHLHNLLRLAGGLYSGSEPHGEEGFAELRKLSVDVVVSVDGARPNLDAARRHGMRYVHIPVGYDGIPEEAGKSLARVAREAEARGETVYFHCHHGKHRGPAAAAAACIGAGVASNAEALAILTKAGTSKDYGGLWRDVESYQAPAPGAELPALVEVAEVDSLAAAMAQLDRGFDNLKLCQASGWGVPPDHPDIVAAQEALIVREAFHEARRNLSGYNEAFAALLEESEVLGAELENQLKSQDFSAATETMNSLGKACQQCHIEYRN